jgi:phospholipid-binding lipoprotein MlaA
VPLALAALLLGACATSPEPAAESPPERASEPAPGSRAEPVPDSAPEPQEPALEPRVDPELEPAPELQAETASEPAAEPAQETASEPPAEPAPETALDAPVEYELEESEEEEFDHDPWQGFNRRTFAVNDAIDRFFFEPLATGWSWVTPEYFRVRLRQFFRNLNFPGYFLNPLLQGDPRQSGVALGRFVLNTTIGIVGFFDPADHHFGLEEREEDFGQTLAVWGTPPGPYIVLPVLTAPGSTSRDLSALPIDSVLNVGDSILLGFLVPGVTIVRGVNQRALVLEEVREARDAAFDWYVFTRNAYLQRRLELIYNGEVPAQERDEDLYDLDEDLYDDEEFDAE